MINALTALPSGLRRGRLIAQGKASWFGGPDDKGVKPDEGLALLSAQDVNRPPWNEMFILKQLAAGFGLARSISPDAPFIAYRFPTHNQAVRDYLRTHPVIIYESDPALAQPGDTIRCLVVWVVDWGPSVTATDKDVDCSKGVLETLRKTTGDEVWVYTIEPDADFHPTIIQPAAPVGAPLDLGIPGPTSKALPPVQDGPNSARLAPEGMHMDNAKSYSTQARESAGKLLETIAATDKLALLHTVGEGIHEVEHILDAPGPEKKSWVIQKADPLVTKLAGGDSFTKLLIQQAIGYLIDHIVSLYNAHQIGVVGTVATPLAAATGTSK